jgi:hypothetical protein
MLENFSNENKRQHLGVVSSYNEKHYKISLTNVDKLNFNAFLGLGDIADYNKFFYMKYRTGHSNNDTYKESIDSLLLNRFLRRTSYPIQRFARLKNFQFSTRNMYQDLMLAIQDYLYQVKLKPEYYKGLCYDLKKDLSLRLKLCNIQLYFINLMAKEIKFRRQKGKTPTTFQAWCMQITRKCEKGQALWLGLYRQFIFFIRNIWEAILQLSTLEYSYTRSLNISAMVFLCVKIKSLSIPSAFDISEKILFSFITEIKKLTANKNIYYSFRKAALIFLVISSIDDVFQELLPIYYLQRRIMDADNFLCETRFKESFSIIMKWLSMNLVEFSIFYVRPISVLTHWVYLAIFLWEMIFNYNIVLAPSLFSRHIFFTCMMESTMNKASFMLSKAKQATILPKKFTNHSYFTYQEFKHYKPIRKNTKDTPKNFRKFNNYQKKS